MIVFAGFVSYRKNLVFIEGINRGKGNVVYLNVTRLGKRETKTILKDTLHRQYDIRWLQLFRLNRSPSCVFDDITTEWFKNPLKL